MLGALHRLLVFFNREDALPAAGARECDGVAADAGEGVDDGGFGRGRGFGDVCCDFTSWVLVGRDFGVRKVKLLCDGFGGYAKPGVFGHPDAFVVLLPDFEALEPVSSRGQY